MSVLDITKEQTAVTEIKWCSNSLWNIHKTQHTAGGIRLAQEKANWMANGDNLVDSKHAAKNLIKALQKAIDLGWVV